MFLQASKKFFIALMVTAILASLIDVSPIASVFIRRTEAIGVNLLSNPSFETWSSGIPTGWKRTAVGNGTMTAISTTGYKCDGTYSARLEAPASGDRIVLNQWNVAVSGATLYRASVKCRTSKISGTGNLKVYFKDSSGANISSKLTSLYKEETDDFMYAELNVTTPANAASIVFEIDIRDGGLVWVDSASFASVTNKVANGSFETQEPGGAWVYYQSPATTGGSATWLDTGGSDLNCAMRIDTTYADDYVALKHTLPLETGYRRYKVETLYKVSTLEDGAAAKMKIYWLDSSGTAIEVIETPVIDTSGSWRKLTRTVMKPANAVNMRIDLAGGYGQTSIAWDQIVVEPWHDIVKADGTQATNITQAHDWGNEIPADIFWSLIPSATLNPTSDSVWTNSLVRKYFFGLDGYNYANYYVPFNLDRLDANTPTLASTIGVTANKGDAPRVKAGDLPYNAYALIGGNSQYYAGGIQSTAGAQAIAYKLTGDVKYKNRAQEICDFAAYTQYTPDGDNDFVRINYPLEWNTVVNNGWNTKSRGGWDYKFNWAWTDAYGYTYHRHDVDNHVSSQIAANIVNAYSSTNRTSDLDAVLDFVYYQLPRCGYNYGYYNNHKYYWFEYGPSGTGVPNDSSQPIEDACDNINAAIAHITAKAGYYNNDPKLLELSRGLLWYLCREYEYDGEFYYYAAESTKNGLTGLDNSHEVMLMWDMLHAFAYLKEAGVDLSMEEPVITNALNMTISKKEWYEGSKYIKAAKAFDGTVAPNSSFDIVTYLQITGASSLSNVKWWDEIGGNMVVPGTINVRISRMQPPTSGNNNWSIDTSRDVVYSVNPAQIQTSGLQLPWTLNPGEVYRISYSLSTNASFNRNTDKMPNSRVALYANENGVNQLRTIAAVAPPLDTDLQVNAANFMSFPAKLFFPFSDAVTPQVTVSTAPAAVSYPGDTWGSGQAGTETYIYFKDLIKPAADSGDSWGGSIYGQFDYNSNASNDFVEFKFYLPSSATATYNVQLERLKNASGGIYQVSIDGTNQGSPVDGYTGTGTVLYTDLGNKSLAPGWHTIRFTVTGKNTNSQYYYISVKGLKLVKQ